MVKFDQTMFGYLRECNMSRPPQYEVCKFFAKTIRLGQFVKDVESFAGYLQNIGIKKGDNVVLCLSNIPSALVSFYAINAVGAIANIAHPLMNSKALAKLSLEMKPKAFILFDEFYGEYKEWLDKEKAPIIMCSASDYLPIFAKQFYPMAVYSKTKNIPKNGLIIRFRDALNKFEIAPTEQIKGEDIAVYLHSGGTCGKSKTVMLSNSALNHLADNIIATIDYKTFSSDSMLMVLPIFHTFGLGVCMHTMLSHGIKIILVPQFSAKRVCRLIKHYRITYLTGVPNMFKKMLASGRFCGKKLKCIKACYCGGDKLQEDTKNAFERALISAGSGLKISEGYGLTEACVCCINTMESYENGSIGTPVKSMKFAIVDSQNQFLDSGQRGEIAISGTTLMTGYFNDETATREAFFEDNQGVLWLKTGDYGYINASGHVYFVDRYKRLIKISGYNVFPQEIEDIVNSFDFVQNCCAIRIEDDNKKVGVKLLMTLKKGCVFDKEKEEIIMNKIQVKLMKYSKPLSIEILDELPLTQIGKVDFKAVEAEFNK